MRYIARSARHDEGPVAPALGGGVRGNRRQFRVFPLFSIMSILVGYGIAEMLIPEDTYYLDGALFAPSLALTLGLVSGVLVAGISSPASVLRAESILSVGMVYWITLDPM